jgi:hypothetical protein
VQVGMMTSSSEYSLTCDSPASRGRVGVGGRPTKIKTPT